MRRKTWREKATQDAITKKITRQRNPITTYTGLAQEFGAPVYPNYTGAGGPAASSAFRAHVRTAAGNIFS